MTNFSLKNPFPQLYFLEARGEVFSFKGPLSRIFLLHRSIFYPYISLKNVFEKFKMKKKTLKKSSKVGAARFLALPIPPRPHSGFLLLPRGKMAALPHCPTFGMIPRRYPTVLPPLGPQRLRILAAWPPFPLGSH